MTNQITINKNLSTIPIIKVYLSNPEVPSKSLKKITLQPVNQKGIYLLSPVVVVVVMMLVTFKWQK